MKLFLKGSRCYTEKCAVEKRNFPPGQHGKRRIKMQGYGVQLREKQKVKRVYGVLEKQFRLTFQEAARKKGVTGEMLLQGLERRLDNVIYRLGFGSSRAQARQMVAHGHVKVDGKKVDIPSYEVRPGQTLTLKDKMSKNVHVQAALQLVRGRGVAPWLQHAEGAASGSMANLPRREEITLPIQEQLIVELYSK